eukprot:NODE_832_length_3846_cov_0.252736.p2 type:complete len:301 gc:universal NODE_832_length_3846_cov_0.252736:3621-2719(-)
MFRADAIEHLKKSPFFKEVPNLNDSDAGLKEAISKIVAGLPLNHEETKIQKALMPLLKGIKKERQKCDLLAKANKELTREIKILKSKDINMDDLQNNKLKTPDYFDFQRLIDNAPFGNDQYDELAEENRRIQQECNLLKLKYKGQEELNHYLKMENDNLNQKSQQSRSCYEKSNDELLKIKCVYQETLTQLKLSQAGDNTVSPNAFNHCGVQTDNSMETDLISKIHLNSQGNQKGDLILQLIEKERCINELRQKMSNERLELSKAAAYQTELLQENKVLRDELRETLTLIAKLESLDHIN